MVSVLTNTATYGMFTGAEPVSVVKVLLVVGIIGCVVGLKYIH
jgi:quaternary ammonium compound-resistance protein SugE